MVHIPRTLQLVEKYTRLISEMIPIFGHKKLFVSHFCFGMFQHEINIYVYESEVKNCFQARGDTCICCKTSAIITSLTVQQKQDKSHTESAFSRQPFSSILTVIRHINCTMRYLLSDFCTFLIVYFS